MWQVTGREPALSPNNYVPSEKSLLDSALRENRTPYSQIVTRFGKINLEAAKFFFELAISGERSLS